MSTTISSAPHANVSTGNNQQLPRKNLSPQEVLRLYCSQLFTRTPDCGEVGVAVCEALDIHRPQFLFMGSVNFFLEDADKDPSQRRHYGFVTLLDEVLIGSSKDFQEGTFSTMSLREANIHEFEYSWLRGGKSPGSQEIRHVVKPGESIFFHWKDGCLPIHDVSINQVVAEDNPPSRMPKMGDTLVFRLHGVNRKEKLDSDPTKNSVKAYPWMLDDDLEEASRQYQHRKEYVVLRRTQKKNGKHNDEILWQGGYPVQREGLADSPCYSTQKIIFAVRQWAPGDSDIDMQPRWKEVPNWIGKSEEEIEAS
jgi:hypothetical protein